MPQPKRYTYDGETLSQTQWAARRGLDLRTLNYRLTQGWSIERALTVEVDADKLQIRPCRWCPRHARAWLEPIDGAAHWHPLPRAVLADALRWARMGGCAQQIQVKAVMCDHCVSPTQGERPCPRRP